MKRIFLALCLLFGGAMFSVGFAQLNENFNTRPSVQDISQIKAYLQDRCWELPGMDINPGAILAIEGDGSLVSPLHSGEKAGMYTPMLELSTNMSLSFTYKFSASVSAGHILKISLTNYNNDVAVVLDNVDMSGKTANNTYTYNRTFERLTAGSYRIHFNFLDADGTTQILIDQFHINAPLLYPSGCNNPPVANNDYFDGAENHKAHGNILQNDYDPNSDHYTPYLISNSQDGDVVMNTDGTFTFSPNAGFTGKSTTFSYQICDNGATPLCSNIAVATITFPGAMVPMRLVDFNASIDDDRDVNIRWTTTFEQGTTRFDIERSLDGTNFKKIGEVKAGGNSQSSKLYGYDDRLRSSTLNSHDVYYRLRLVSAGNMSELSKVLVLRLLNTPSIKTIAVTPNPSRNDINVQVLLRENSYVVMKVTNNKGSEVTRKSSKGISGMNSYLIDGTSGLTPGVYMLEVIINSSERMITKLIKN